MRPPAAERERTTRRGCGLVAHVASWCKAPVPVRCSRWRILSWFLLFKLSEDCIGLARQGGALPGGNGVINETGSQITREDDALLDRSAIRPKHKRQTRREKTKACNDEQQHNSAKCRRKNHRCADACQRNEQQYAHKVLEPERGVFVGADERAQAAGIGRLHEAPPAGGIRAVCLCVRIF